MSFGSVTLNGSNLGSSLQSLLQADEIQPGTDPSYQLCKLIYEYHPLGQKMAESPVKLAQSQARRIAIPDAPEEEVRQAFLEEWLKLGATRHIFNAAKTARMYGIASVAILEKGRDSAEPLDLWRLYKREVAVNIFDPLNTAGSLVLNQDPNALDFLKHGDFVVSGQRYHRSRSNVILNEDPVYISYTTSAFGFVGRSVYQRALYPLKSFINTLVTDDLITLKAGVLIAKQKAPGSVIDNVMSKLFNLKRSLLKEARVGNVLSIGVDEAIETLNMQNLDGAYGVARTNILKNIATAADMPAKLLENETMVAGFGEGVEDAKNIARFINGIREWLEPLYAFFTRIVQYRAWNPDFYATIQRLYPDPYSRMSHEEAFYRWSNSFSATWPNLLEEPDSEKAKIDDVRLKAIIAAVEVFAPILDPDNKAALVQWAIDNFNELKQLFPVGIDFDPDALLSYLPTAETPEEPAEPLPFSARDSLDDGHRIGRLLAAVGRS